MGYIIPVHTVAETGIFQRRAADLLSVEEHSDLIEFLAANPYAGNAEKKAVAKLAAAIKKEHKS